METTTNTTKTNTVTAGWKSTEFWLSLVAAIIGGIVASGLIPSGWPVQVAGAILTALASLGYSGSRAKVKAAAGPLLALVLVASLATGCASWQTDVKPKAIDAAKCLATCTAPCALRCAADLIPSSGAAPQSCKTAQ